MFFHFRLTEETRPRATMILSYFSRFLWVGMTHPCSTVFGGGNLTKASSFSGLPVNPGCWLRTWLRLQGKTPTCGLSVRLKLTHNTVAEFQRQVSRETDQTNHRALLPPHFLRRRVVPAFRERGIRSHLWKEVGLNICRHILKLPQMIRGKRRVSLTRGKTVTVSFSDR